MNIQAPGAWNVIDFFFFRQFETTARLRAVNVLQRKNDSVDAPREVTKERKGRKKSPSMWQLGLLL